jgi:hypothetical protein
MVVNVQFGGPELVRWRRRISRQLDLHFASLRRRVQAVDVRLHRQNTTSEAGFVCDMQVRLRDERRLSVNARGANPNICIADAAARMARTVSREVRRLGIVSG